MKNFVVLTRAGMSAESGLNTFRDANGLWEGHNVMDLATPEAFKRDPKLVLELYNQRIRQLLNLHPNKEHHNLKELEKYFNIHIITQNVDVLHEKAESSNVLHLHAELRKVRSIVNKDIILNWSKDLHLGDVDSVGNQLRPHVVWFGEEVPMLDTAIERVKQADILVIIGTSMQVYTAASLVNYIKRNTPVYSIDPNPSIEKNQYQNITIIKSGAETGTEELIKMLIY